VFIIYIILSILSSVKTFTLYRQFLKKLRIFTFNLLKVQTRFNFLLEHFLKHNFKFVEIMIQFQTSGVVSDGKVYILDRKTGIFTQNQFLTESIFLYGCNSKTNYCKYLKFLPNVYFKFLRNLSKTRKFAMRLNFKFLRNRVPNDNDLSSNDFKYFISRRYLKILPHLKFKFRQKFVKIMNICKLFCSSKFIKLFVFISNVKYSRLTNHLRSESFFTTEIFDFSNVLSSNFYDVYQNCKNLQTLEYFTISSDWQDRNN
ncbi:hypothetical protein AGLY_006319, partial [Aphis glycines]